MSEISIEVNGELRRVPSSTSVAELLQMVSRPRHVAVEVNQEVVPRAEHPNHALRDGDVVELVTLVGGG